MAEWKDIEHKKQSGKDQLTCPECSASRKKKKDRCLSIDYDTGRATCNHCSWSTWRPDDNSDFKPAEETKKEWVRPDFKNKTELGEDELKWFLKRGISQDTVNHFKVTSGISWMRQVYNLLISEGVDKKEAGEKANVNTIQFNYFREGKLINTKFRDGKKNFKLEQGAEKIPYNLDAIRDSEECLWAEGEPDVMVWKQAGYDFAISVPNGANLNTNNFSYLDSCMKSHFKNKKKIYIATDNDEAGLKLKEDLLRVFGRDICYIIEYPKLPYGEYKDKDGNTVQKHTKDANDILLAKGPEFLIKLKKDAKGFAIPGVYSVGDIEEEMWARFRDKDLYPKGTPCYIKAFEEYWSWRKGDINGCIGPANQGKSTMYANTMPTLKSMNEGDIWAVFSPEAFPIADFYDDIIHTYIGKSTDPNFPTRQMSEEQYKEGLEFAKKHYYFVYPEESHDYKTIFDTFKAMIVKYGITGIIIDPINQLERVGDDARARDDQFLSRFYSMLKRFISIHGLYNMTIIHSTARFDQQSGLLLTPNFMSDIEGGQMSSKKVDNILYLYRPNFKININDSYCVIGSAKIRKQKYTGIPGEVSLTFEKEDNRYYDNSGRSTFTGEMKVSLTQMSMDLPLPEELQEEEGNLNKIPEDLDDSDPPF